MYVNGTPRPCYSVRSGLLSSAQVRILFTLMSVCRPSWQCSHRPCMRLRFETLVAKGKRPSRMTSTPRETGLSAPRSGNGGAAQGIPNHGSTTGTTATASQQSMHRNATPLQQLPAQTKGKGAPLFFEVGWSVEAFCFQRGHVMGLRCLAFALVATQVYLLVNALANPHMRFPPAKQILSCALVWGRGSDGAVVPLE